MKPWQKSNYYTPPEDVGEVEETGKMEENIVEGFVCDICGKTFDTKRGLIAHMRVHK